MIVFRMLEQMPNDFANRGAAGLPKNCRPDPPFFQTCGEPFICVDFPQSSEPSNVISGIATILRQRGVIVEPPIFALFGLRQRGKFDP